MTARAPRLSRADLRDMSARPGECFPVEVDVVIADIIGGRVVMTGRRRDIRCGCLPDHSEFFGHRR